MKTRGAYHKAAEQRGCALKCDDSDSERTADERDRVMALSVPSHTVVDVISIQAH